MDQKIEVTDDPMGLGQPPPYTPSDATQAIPAQTAQSTIAAHPVIASDITHTGGLYHVHVAPVILPMLIGNQMGPKPTTLICQSCKQVIVTRIEARANNGTHTGACILALFCLWPCVIIPYCVDKCRNMDHHCPNCDAYIGSYLH